MRGAFCERFPQDLSVLSGIFQQEKMTAVHAAPPAWAPRALGKQDKAEGSRESRVVMVPPDQFSHLQPCWYLGLEDSLWWGCPVHHGRFSSVPGPQKPVILPQPQLRQLKMSLDTVRCAPGVLNQGDFAPQGHFRRGKCMTKHVEVRMEGRHVRQAGVGESGDLGF